MQNIIAHSWIWNVQHLEFSFVQAKEEKAERRARKKAGKQKKYKTVMRTVKRKATKTITRTVTETVTNEETGEEEEVGAVPAVRVFVGIVCFWRGTYVYMTKATHTRP